jgi:hypothetical protein
LAITDPDARTETAPARKRDARNLKRIISSFLHCASGDKPRRFHRQEPEKPMQSSFGMTAGASHIGPPARWPPLHPQMQHHPEG